MFGVRKKFKKLNEITGPPPVGALREIRQNWLKKRSSLSKTMFTTKYEKLEFLRLDFRYIFQGKGR